MRRRWYEQAGTPALMVSPSYDEAGQTFTLDVKQSSPATPGQASKQPVLIPLAVALLGPDGKELPLRLKVGLDFEKLECIDRARPLTPPRSTCWWCRAPHTDGTTLLPGFCSAGVGQASVGHTSALLIAHVETASGVTVMACHRAACRQLHGQPQI